jgi:hypothetical protein
MCWLKLRIKGLIKWNTALKNTSTTFHMLNSQQIEISRLFESWKHNLNNLNVMSDFFSIFFSLDQKGLIELLFVR